MGYYVDHWPGLTLAFTMVATARLSDGLGGQGGAVKSWQLVSSLWGTFIE
jgi:hypothetical protein